LKAVVSTANKDDVLLKLPSALHSEWDKLHVA
jgi:hypothetical protein